MNERKQQNFDTLCLSPKKKTFRIKLRKIFTFFKETRKDSNILQNISISRTKCKNIILNVLCPVEIDRVIDIIQNTKFTIYIDEMSDISNKKWMMFLVRYVHPETLGVCSQLVKSIDIDAKNSS